MTCGKLLLLLLLALPWAARAQEFTPIYDNLDRLNDIMNNWQISIDEQRKDNESLKASMSTLSELLREQGKLLNEAREEQQRREAIEQRQAQLLLTYITKSKRLKIGLTAGIPLAVGAGILAGLLMSR
jgi:hypothetical protein